MDGFNHTFPALRGIQAGAEFYVAMCPMRLLPKLFVFDDDEVPPELRAQRTLNRRRIPEIARYLVKNRYNYVVSALTASVDTSVGFTPLGNESGRQMIGTLQLPMDARLLINDGQHRRAAVEEAMVECPELRDDHVPVIFFVDRGLKRSQQMFADLNPTCHPAERFPEHSLRSARPQFGTGALYCYVRRRFQGDDGDGAFEHFEPEY